MMCLTLRDGKIICIQFKWSIEHSFMKQFLLYIRCVFEDCIFFCDVGELGESAENAKKHKYVVFYCSWQRIFALKFFHLYKAVTVRNCKYVKIRTNCVLYKTMLLGYGHGVSVRHWHGAQIPRAPQNIGLARWSCTHSHIHHFYPPKIFMKHLIVLKLMKIPPHLIKWSKFFPV